MDTTTPIQQDASSTAPPLDQVELTAKYKYPIFEGFSGERYLKSILRKILPLSLYATWDILVVDFQARGNDAYLSVSRLAEARERTERKIRLDLAELKARKLLCYRLTQKAFRQRDGSTKIKTVVVKDFDGLYDLAYEYHVWCESECHIDADRDLMDAVKQNDLLCRKLLRFDNYRRLLCNQCPGRKAQVKETHRWYTEYAYGGQEEDIETTAAPVPATNAPPLHEERASDADKKKSATFRNLSMQKDMQEEVQEDSQERIETNDYLYSLNGDSFDSEECFEYRSEFPCPTHACSQKQGSVAEDYTNTNPPTHEASPTPPTTNQETNHLSQHDDVAARPARRESIEQDAMIEHARRAMALVGTTTTTPKGRRTFTATVPAKPAPRPHSLTTSFLHEIGGPFCDKNKKGSNTQALRLIQDAACEPGDAVKLLIRSYISASTAKVKPEHRHADGDNRMPLFFFFLRTFCKAWNDNTFHYTNEQLLADISQDERLLLWFSEHAHSLQDAGETHSTSPDRRPDELSASTTQEAAETENEETATPGTTYQRRSHSKRSVCTEDRDKREQHAKSLKWKLIAAGVPQVSVGLEHRCGCPLYYERNRKDRCVHCEGDSTWNESILALIASVFEQS